MQVETPQSKLKVIVVDEVDDQLLFAHRINAALAEIERMGGVLIPPIQLATTPFGAVTYTALLLYRVQSEEVR